ncbi:MAG TPA: hypothetical protein VFM07_05930 [Intrasporangium sp.]|nr:hypothetical protein [Intrasporangium sp.]
MDTRPEIPDPQHDEHVAFPDEAASRPPESWWEPAPPPVPPRPPVPGPASGMARRRRRSAGWWAVVAVFLFGSAMTGHTGDLFAHGGIGSGSAGGEAPAPSNIELVEQPVAPSGELVPTDVPLYAIPMGTLWFRLEVVGNDPRGTIGVSAGSGSSVETGEVPLPYAARLTRDNPEDTLSIMVRGAYGQRQVQCRVYLDDALVAIGTGAGTATCEVPAWR